MMAQLRMWKPLKRDLNKSLRTKFWLHNYRKE
jgi:hypothetical protein